MPGWEWEDEAGVVHRNDEPLAGEAMPGGPVMLSWADVEASQDWDAAGMNLAIHEFAHKLDMRNGDANGCPPLPAEMPPHVWKKTMLGGLRAFPERASSAAITRRSIRMRPRVPAEFFAVLSEVFFVEPACCCTNIPGLPAVHAVLPAGPGVADGAAARRIATSVVPSAPAVFRRVRLPSMRSGARRLRSDRSCESVRRWPRSSSWSPS